MATRNKTAAFLQQRNSIRQTRPRIAPSDHIALNIAPHLPGLRRGGGYVQLTKLEGGLSESPPMGPMLGGQAVPGLPPQWVDISEKVKEDMARIRTKMTELGKAQAKALLPSFGADAEKGKKSEHEERMEVLTSEITRALKSCEQRLQRLSSDPGSDASNTICRNIQRSMATDLQTLSMEFRRQSKQYLKRLQEQQQPKAQSQSAFGASSTSSRQQAAAVQEDDDMFDGGLDNQVLLQKKGNAVDLERDREIQEIFQSVQDLAQIMKDLSVLVIDQGTVVDRIDYNIQNVSAKVDKGVEQLEKAEKMQKRTALVACIMCLMVACIILFILLVLKKLLFLI